MSEEAAAAGDAPAPKKSKKMLVIVAGLVLLLAGGGGGAWFMMKGPSGDAQADTKPPKPPVFMPLETFTVNLQGGEQYLQTDITLQVVDAAQADEIKLQMPRVRSRLLSLLSSKEPDALVTAEHKKQLAAEIRDQIAVPFHPKGKPQKVEDVLFTTFVIQ